MQQCSGSVLRCTFATNLAAAGTVLADGGGVFAERSTVEWTDCTFTGNSSQAGGGGMYSYLQDHSVLRGCTFRGNSANAGGALYLETSLASVLDCELAANEASSGGALFLEKSSYPLFQGCAFDSNRAVPFSGGAVDCWKSHPVFRTCRFVANRADVRGGAIGLHTTSDATLEGCLVLRNSADADGGAIWAVDSAVLQVQGCTIAASSAGGAGGGVYAADDASIAVDASVLAFATAGEAVACAGNAAVTLSCSDVYGNAGGDWVGCIAAQAGTDGNRSADPLFCDLAGDDDRVTLPDSPCLAANNACGVAIGTGSAGCGCPVDATILVPADAPTITAALAMALPGDVIGVCSGTYPESLELVDGVHVVGVRSDLAVVRAPSPGDALVRAVAITDSTLVAGLRLDGAGIVTQVVRAESGTTALQLAGNAITGGATYGVLNGPDSRVRIGGELPLANDLFGNGGATPVQVRNENVAADSLDALLNWWGTTSYDVILTQLEGPIASCPITNAAHTDTLCAPLSSLSAPDPRRGAALALSLGPNPFRDGTELRFVLPRDDASVRVTVYDVRGRRVRVLRTGPAPAGADAVRWAGTDGRGHPVAPGVYFLRLESAASGGATGRVVRLR
jgi:Right handed beta helix region/FlgD Ig-like domain